MTDRLFLTLADVLAIHESRIRKYGGSSGVRDWNSSARPSATSARRSGGAFLHESIFEMAAAYLYGICRNHPFLENKRTALACGLVFLELNGVTVASDPDELCELVIGVAEGRTSKAAVAVFFERFAG